MSDYRHNEFIGFGTCAPRNFIPDAVYRWLFFPQVKTKNGLPTVAPYGLRKIEAQLLSEGFDVLTVAPKHLKRYLPKARALGIHVMDPFGLGPASTTLAFVLKAEPFLAQYFRALLSDPEVKRAKDRGLKIIVGGPGSWQFKYRQRFIEEHGVDCIVMGEAEKVIGNVFRAALKGDDLPLFYETSINDAPTLEEIPDIVNASVNGLIEIGRGCCRGCQFCSVTLRPLRWYSLDKIMREMDANVKAGNVTWACLHAEDVMLYGSKNTSPDEDKLIKLHNLASKKAHGLAWSHCSLAAVAANPNLFRKISEIILQKQAWWGAEIGIETGSPRIAKKMMPAKAHPFKAEQWPEVVREGMGLMHDHNMVPAGTLIVGTPEETEDDVLKTIELMDDLRDFRSLIVPLFFVPMGKLKDEHWFKDTHMTELHKELLIRCMEHDFHWIDNLLDWSFIGSAYGIVLRPFYRAFASIAKHRARKAGLASRL